MSAHRLSLCVFTSASETIDHRYFDLAQEVGEAMSARGIDLVTGGGRVSTMGILARTVRAGGGSTTGVIPRSLVGWEVADEDADELLISDNMRDRKGLMDALSDGFLALPGGMGTLEELLEAWVGRALGMHRKPVVILDPWGDFAPLHVLLNELATKGLVGLATLADAEWTTDVSSAMAALTTAWAAGEGRGAVAVDSPSGRRAEWLESD